MDNFFLSGCVFIIYSSIFFIIKRQILPSGVMTAMWGIACIFISIITHGIWDTLDLYTLYHFKWMDKYILYFTIASIAGFSIAHMLGTPVALKTNIKLDYLNWLTTKYRFIMKLNCALGIARIIIFLSLFGWGGFYEYRINAELGMQSISGWAAIVFRISNYILLLSNFYVAIVGLKHGIFGLNKKEALSTFLLFIPVQLSTGGRLWILYFILYYFGAYMIGKMYTNRNSFATKKETRFLMKFGLILCLLIAFVGILKTGDDSEDKTAYDKYAYITEGILASESCMDYNGGDKFDNLKYGLFSTGVSKSSAYFGWRKLLIQSKISSIIECVIVYLYLDFGYYNSLFIWFIFCLFFEIWYLNCMKRLNIFHFFTMIIILKFLYESILSNPIIFCIPSFELLILLYLFKNLIFVKGR